MLTSGEKYRTTLLCYHCGADMTAFWARTEDQTYPNIRRYWNVLDANVMTNGSPDCVYIPSNSLYNGRVSLKQQKFPRNLGTTSKFYAPVGRHQAIATLNTHRRWHHRTKFTLGVNTTSRICASLLRGPISVMKNRKTSHWCF